MIKFMVFFMVMTMINDSKTFVDTTHTGWWFVHVYTAQKNTVDLGMVYGLLGVSH